MSGRWVSLYRGVAACAGLAMATPPVSAEDPPSPPNPVPPPSPAPEPARALTITFEESSARLPQDEIRAAVARELGRPVTSSGDDPAESLVIGLDDERGLVVRYRTSRGALERYLPLPARTEDVVLMVALAAGNLARDPTLAPTPDAPKESAPAPAVVEPSSDEAASEARPPPDLPREPRPGPKKAFSRRHHIGLHVAQDIALVGGSNVCDSLLGQQSDNYSCFYEGSDDEPFWHTPFPIQDEIKTRAVFATTRVLLSYDFAALPWFTIGGRVGYALGGGPASGQRPAEVPPNGDPNELPARAKGVGGVNFLPWHAEARLALFYPSLDRPFSAFLAAGAGVAQVDAKVSISERDCAFTRDPSWDPAGGSFSDCRTGRPSFEWEALPETRVDAWKKLGQGFVKLGVGALVTPVPEVSIAVGLDAMVMFPAHGVVFEPSLGVVHAL